MLLVTYSPPLVFVSVLVATMAAFTALRLTGGLRTLSPIARRPVIARAAVALGGGIWAMHFVGMLAVGLPVPVRYEALPTLLSALFAILVVGIGFIVLHFGPRGWQRIVLAGSLTGMGIVGMHYLGMSAVSGNCAVVYSPWGIALASAIGLGASIFGLWLAYGRRSKMTTALGAVALGLAINAMHYSAMFFTSFLSLDFVRAVPESAISTDALAMVVSLAAFAICGLFLLMAIPVESLERDPVVALQLASGSGPLVKGPLVKGPLVEGPPVEGPLVDGPGAGIAANRMPRQDQHDSQSLREPDVPLASDSAPAPEAPKSVTPGAAPVVPGPSQANHALEGTHAPAAPGPPASGAGETPAAGPLSAGVVLSRALEQAGPPADSPPAPLRVPYERNNTIRFVAEDRVAAVRADGHYSWLITDSGELFCPWPISRFESAVTPDTFIRTHRSYLARIAQVTGFRRDGDRAVCLLGDDGDTEIPISRNRIAAVRLALGS